MTAAEVMLWGTRIGTVVFDEMTGVASFEYAPYFLTSGIEVSPVMMPLSEKVYSFPELAKSSFHGLPGLLADSLPDKFGNAVIRSWLQAQGRAEESFNPVERLCYTGNRGMGALEYVPARGPSAAESESIHLDQLVRLAAQVLQSRENMHAKTGEKALEEIIKVGTSAGGARAKAVIAWNEKTGDIRSGQIKAGQGYEYWLIKFDDVKGNGDKEGEDDPQYTRIEYAYSLMAKAAGIEMNECRILRENGRYHFMTRRFDRDVFTGEKLHMQTLGAILHADYNLPGICSYEQAAGVMRQLRIAGEDIRQLFRRMVFNVMARNQDDHVKNISFLMDRRGKWQLSPAYDMTYAYNPGGLWTGTHQMSINGKRDRIGIEDLLASAGSFGIKKAGALKILEDVGKSLRNWQEYAEQAGLNEHTAAAIEKQFILSE